MTPLKLHLTPGSRVGETLKLFQDICSINSRFSITPVKALPGLRPEHRARWGWNLWAGPEPQAVQQGAQGSGLAWGGQE